MNYSMLNDVDYLVAWYDNSCLNDHHDNVTQQADGPSTNASRQMSLADTTFELCQNLSVLMEYYDYDLDETSPHPERFIVPMIFSITFVIGLLGNGLVIYVVLKSGATNTITNLYLMNLAVTDVMFLVFCVPFTAVSYVIPYWPFGEAMCKVVNYMMAVTVASTVMTMTALSVDRYHAVVHPDSSKTYRTPRRTIALLAVIWLVSFLSLIPIARVSRTVQYWHYGAENHFCVEYFTSLVYRRVYTLSLFILLYGVPLAVIGLCYYFMAKTLWNSVSPGFLRNNTAKVLRARRRVSKMILVIITAFAICWLPIHCVQMHSDFGRPTHTMSHDVIKIVALVLAYVNSALNPIIYGFMSENFRKCCKLAFTGFCGVKSKSAKRNNVFIVVDPEAMPSSNQSTKVRTDQSTKVPSDQSTNIPTDQSTKIPTDQSTKIQTDQSTKVRLLLLSNRPRAHTEPTVYHESAL